MTVNFIALVTLIALVAVAVKVCVARAGTRAPRALLREALTVLAPTTETTLPVLARRVLRAMVESVTIGVGGTPLVPTGFVVVLAPADETMLDPVRRWFCKDVATAFVTRLSSRSGLSSIATPAVSLAVDPNRPVGAPRAMPTYAPVTVVGGGPADRPEVRTTQPDAVPLLVGDGSTWRLRGSTVVGRSSSCDVVLANELVSRSHCRVFPAGGGWAVEDLGSQNGTAIGTHRVRGPAPLRGGDELVLAGGVSLRFTDQPSHRPQPASVTKTRQWGQ